MRSRGGVRGAGDLCGVDGGARGQGTAGGLFGPPACLPVRRDCVQLAEWGRLGYGYTARWQCMCSCVRVLTLDGLQCDLSQLEDAVELCAELMSGSANCEGRGEGIVEESPVRGASSLPPPVPKLLCGSFLLCPQRADIRSPPRCPVQQEALEEEAILLHYGFFLMTLMLTLGVSACLQLCT